MAPRRQTGVVGGRDKERMTVRVRLVGGRLTSPQAKRLAELAEAHGEGRVHLTTRQGIELPRIAADRIAAVTGALAEVGLTAGSTGPTVRSIVACAGDTCSHALIDSQALAQRVDERLAGCGLLPHKFKIGITGCPNSCAKPRENDLGIMGSARVELDAERCHSCGACIKKCPQPGVLSLDDNGAMHMVADLCNRCAYCVDACPNEAWRIRERIYAIFVGGRMGRRPRMAQPLAARLTGEAQVLAAVEAIVAWYAAHGATKERLAETIQRVGQQSLTQAVIDRLPAAPDA